MLTRKERAKTILHTEDLIDFSADLCAVKFFTTGTQSFGDITKKLQLLDSISMYVEFYEQVESNPKKR